MAGVCGDGILGATEACDDGNTTGGDGCSADCKRSRPATSAACPGRPCVPACGDGKIDRRRGVRRRQHDGRRRLLRRPARSSRARPATTARRRPGKCTAPICGNGMKEGSEGCDCGTDTDRASPRGLQGPERSLLRRRHRLLEDLHQGAELPRRRGEDAGLRHRAAATATIETGRGAATTATCDNGDGCSHDLQDRGRLHVQPQMRRTTRSPARSRATPASAWSSRSSTATSRTRTSSGGHPDFFYLGASVTGGPSITGVHGQAGAITFNKRYCVPNSSGPAKKNDSTNRCWDLAQANLGRERQAGVQHGAHGRR